MKKGCYHRNKELFPDYIANNRDWSHPSYIGVMIDWHNFPASLHHLACVCSQRAREGGYSAFAIGFYGECHAGKDLKKILEDLTDNSMSTGCKSNQYKECDLEIDEECTGAAMTEYVYVLSQKATPGCSQWLSQGSCSKSCGGGEQIFTQSCLSNKNQAALLTKSVSCNTRACLTLA